MNVTMKSSGTTKRIPAGSEKIGSDRNRGIESDGTFSISSNPSELVER